jgi:hypothetical protein
MGRDSDLDCETNTMKLTKRGKRVRAVLILAGIIALYYVSTHLWWTGTGYCWGTITECFMGEL